MKVLLTGASGQLGSALRRSRSAGVQLVCTSRRPLAQEPVLAGQPCDQSVVVDLSDTHAVRAMLQQHHFDIIINAAAWTAVDAAEQQPQAVWQLNAELPAQLAAYACEQDALLLHYSTDYVYDGSKQAAYVETDLPAPLNVYGRSKLAGDQAIIDSGCRHLILRTSWVYGGPSGNFLHTIAQRLCQGQPLRVVNDQIGCPSWSMDIARCSWQALSSVSVQPGFNPGLYHLAGNDAMSWYDFALEIQSELLAAQALADSSGVSACTSAEYPQQAKRPAAVALDCSGFQRRFDCHTGGRAAIRAATREWLANPEQTPTLIN